ncbi:MAG: hypothetical protein P8N76_26840 [Pirellulaceae bacterium]|nr:hypothetical protein [Pirellulaceae bacterium]
MALPKLHLQLAAASDHRFPRRRVRRTGVTLVEILVSVALTLLVVLAVVRVFEVLGGNVTESRTILELSGQLRNVSAQLQNDLNRVTVRTLPPIDPASGAGYLEIIEGVRSDRDIDGDSIVNTADPQADPFAVRVENGQPPRDTEVTSPEFLNRVANVLGDTDDMFMATLRSTGKPFTGQIGGQIYESPLAEVVWWIQPMQPAMGASSTAGATGLAIHRRVLLIRPDLNHVPAVRQQLASAGTDYHKFLALNDLSVRPSTSGFVANSLQDLTNRENRFAHWPTNLNTMGPGNFPFSVNRDWLIPALDRRDLVMADALAFDIRVFDRSSPLIKPTPTSPYVVSATDPGFYTTNGSGQQAGLGAYVDLGYLPKPNSQPPVSHFSGLPHPRSGLSSLNGTFNPLAPRVYCSWSTKYETDGVPQFGGLDIGTNGLDDDGDGIVDGATERDTSAPYPIPLRGVEVLIRCQEFSSGQVRQASVVGEFLPE